MAQTINDMLGINATLASGTLTLQVADFTDDSNTPYLASPTTATPHQVVAPCFWNCTGIVIAIVSVGVSWSLIRASNYKLEAANNKLEVNTAVEQVRKVSDGLEKSVEQLPLDPTEKQVLQKQLETAETELIETQQEILSDEDNTETK